MHPALRVAGHWLQDTHRESIVVVIRAIKCLESMAVVYDINKFSTVSVISNFVS